MVIIVSSLLTVVAVASAAPDVIITLKHGNTVEAQTEQQLRALLRRYDVAPWIIASRIDIDFQAIPHSHPVLTLHARHRDQPDLLLSTFIHEELHWWLESHVEQTAAAVSELRKRFPVLAVGGLDGADTGESKAMDVMTFWSTDHYRELYKLVLSNEPSIREVVLAHGLNCCTASSKALRPTTAGSSTTLRG